MNEPVAIVDEDLKCVYSNSPKLLPVDESIAGFFTCDKTELLYNPNVKMAVINGCSYSVRVIPIDGELYLCEFFDLASVLGLAENTDFHGRFFPIIDIIERCTSEFWRGSSTLEDMLKDNNQDALKVTLDMKKHLVKLSSASKNLVEYMNLLKFTPRSVTPLNLPAFAKDVVDSCNAELLNSGRYVDFVCDEPYIFINAQQRHVVSVLVNVIQNALLYSTRDCVPQLTITTSNNTPSGEAIIRLVNNSALYVEGERRNYAWQRMGYGIPMVRRFAEFSGGSFELREENGIFTAIIELPIIPDKVFDQVGHQLSSGGFKHFDTGIPGILEIKMREIVNLFSE